MSDELNAAAATLTEKLAGSSFSGSAKFTVNGVGSIVVDGAEVRVSDDPADVTLSADADVFQDMMSGDLDPTSAFMSGRLAIDGDMGVALQLAGALG